MNEENKEIEMVKAAWRKVEWRRPQIVSLKTTTPARWWIETGGIVAVLVAVLALPYIGKSKAPSSDVWVEAVVAPAKSDNTPPADEAFFYTCADIRRAASMFPSVWAAERAARQAGASDKQIEHARKCFLR